MTSEEIVEEIDQLRFRLTDMKHKSIREIIDKTRDAYNDLLDISIKIEFNVPYEEGLDELVRKTRFNLVKMFNLCSSANSIKKDFEEICLDLISISYIIKKKTR